MKRALARCQAIALQLRRIQTVTCVRGDLLDRARSLCIPPKGIFQPYSLWDPAAGRCKPRHRFDGGSCAGGKRRYPPGKHHAHALSQSIAMYRNAPARLAAAQNSCQRGRAGRRDRGVAEQAVRQRGCAAARRLNDRNLVNLYCR